MMLHTKIVNRLDVRLSVLIAIVMVIWCSSLIIAIKKIETERTNKYFDIEMGKLEADIKNQHNNILNNILLEHDVALKLLLSDLSTIHKLGWIELKTFNDKEYLIGVKLNGHSKSLLIKQYIIEHDGKEYGRLSYAKEAFPFLRNYISNVWIFISISVMVLIFYIIRQFISKQVVIPIRSMVQFYDINNKCNKSNLVDEKGLATEVKQLLKYLSDMREALDLYQEQLAKNASLAAIGQSTAMIAHDVRRPLASMKALLTSLPMIKEDPAQVNKMIAAVDGSIARTNELLNDVLEFSKDSTSLVRANHNPQSIITSALSEVFAGKENVDVAVEYNLRHKNYLNVDGDRIVRVLSNIVGNAVEAMDGKGKIWIKTEDVGPNMRVIIGNDGPLIPEEALNKLFDPFFTKGKKSGTGLGLSISQKIADMHGGLISVTSLKPRETEFQVELPASEGRLEVNEAELIHHSNEFKLFLEEEAQREEYGDTANTADFMRIHKERDRPSYMLIVDDEPLFRETVRSLLNSIPQVKDHVKVVEAGNAAEALKIFEAREFDYVVADIDMGKNKMNGYEMSHFIMEKYPQTRVLIHSNKRREEMDKDIRRLENQNFMGFLPKPMTSSELLQFLACKTFEVTANVAARESAKKKILVVNDDDCLLVSLKFMLNSPEVQVLTATNVSDAIKHTASHKMDLILSDINLGQDEPSGYDFLKQVRDTDKQTPFYFVSSYSAKEEGPKATKLGATGYLQLPVDEKMVKELLN